MFVIKKIIFGVYWMGIVEIVVKNIEFSFDEIVYVYIKIFIVLFDGFISCWDEKY